MHDASTSPSSDFATTQLTPERIDELAHDIARHAALISAATYELLVKIRIFDEAKGWAKQGAQDCAAWLSWRTGVGRETAKQQLDVAHRLLEFPMVADAFCKGEITASTGKLSPPASMLTSLLLASALADAAAASPHVGAPAGRATQTVPPGRRRGVLRRESRAARCRGVAIIGTCVGKVVFPGVFRDVAEGGSHLSEDVDPV